MYRKIFNTTVSGSNLLSTLSSGDITALEFIGAINRAPAIDLNTSDYYLTNTDMVQACINFQLVNATAIPNDRFLFLGADTSYFAKEWINLFDLSIGKKVILTFQVDYAEVSEDGNVMIGNTSLLTANHIRIETNGLGNYEPFTILLPGYSGAGNQKRVEVFATNTTEGEEVVVFNCLNG